VKVFDRLADLSQLVGQPLATSDWITVDQSMIDAFAHTTQDAQWIHVDPQRAAQGPFGATIAHGFLTLSLHSALSMSAFRVADVRMGVNAGFDRVRFTAPVLVGSRVRGHFAVHSFEAIDGGAKMTLQVTVETEGQDRPASVALWLTRQYL
jgi:acyl dehydratase